MSHLLVLLLAAMAWIASLFAAGFERLARGEPGTVSVFPAIPFFPLIAWGLAYLFHRLSFPLGATILGAVHAALLALFAISIVKAWVKVRRAQKS